ncbi:hypothetical protein ACKC9G_01390 [Pokkaliibacter sp. CJK22405]|uniref:hypothetical protein n=1 Tax=Pokkaliibacter sp. CJK22405 TaxID=3384615 RepID=UPI0039848C3B
MPTTPLLKALMSLLSVAMMLIGLLIAVLSVRSLYFSVTSMFGLGSEGGDFDFAVVYGGFIIGPLFIAMAIWVMGLGYRTLKHQFFPEPEAPAVDESDKSNEQDKEDIREF